MAFIAILFYNAPRLADWPKLEHTDIKISS